MFKTMASTVMAEGTREKCTRPITAALPFKLGELVLFKLVLFLLDYSSI